jgi:hypothetical protein
VQFEEVREALEREKDGEGKEVDSGANPHPAMLPPNMKFL